MLALYCANLGDLEVILLTSSNYALALDLRYCYPAARARISFAACHPTFCIAPDRSLSITPPRTASCGETRHGFSSRSSTESLFHRPSQSGDTQVYPYTPIVEQFIDIDTTSRPNGHHSIYRAHNGTSNPEQSGWG